MKETTSTAFAIAPPTTTTSKSAYYRRCILSVFAILLLGVSFAQKPKKAAPSDKKEPLEHVFTVTKEIPHTPIKNQANSGTCWSFSGIGFLESELMRTGHNDTFDFSEMWVVRNIYKEKVVKYVRMHGNINLSPGGSFHDVLHSCATYGIIPAAAYNGLQYGSTTHNHGELDRVIASFGKSIVDGGKLTTGWMSALEGVLTAYLGAIPEKFTYKGVEYTPMTFAQSTGLNMDDYVSITSYTHHPFYQSFILEIPDNWAFGSSYNVPLDDMMAVIDYALENGYSVAWGADVSEKSFSRDVATIPEEKQTDMVGTDQARWTREQAKINTEQLPEEKNITQEMRQDGFDNYETTDDHGMQIIGIAHDQTGKRFYKVKNSWGTGGKYKGYLFASVPYTQYKTMNIVVHKNAIPAALRTKLNLK